MENPEYFLAHPISRRSLDLMTPHSLRTHDIISATLAAPFARPFHRLKWHRDPVAGPIICVYICICGGGRRSALCLSIEPLIWVRTLIRPPAPHANALFILGAASQNARMSHTFVDNTRLPAKGSASSGKWGGLLEPLLANIKMLPIWSSLHSIG